MPFARGSAHRGAGVNQNAVALPQPVRIPQTRRTCSPRKPRLTIEPTGSNRYPWLFRVKWPSEPWKNSQWHSWDEALIALGLKKR